MEVQVLQHLLQHLILLPHVILLFTKKKQLAHRQLPEYRIPITSHTIHSLTPIVQVAHHITTHNVKRSRHTAQYLFQHRQECALFSLRLYHIVQHTERTHITVLGILQCRQRIDAAQLYLVKLLVVALRIALRFDKSGKETFPLTVDIHHSVTA